jgi:hypothetical protein
MKASGHLRHPASGRSPGAHWIRGWVSSRTGLDAVEEGESGTPCQESDPDPSAGQTIAVAIPTAPSRPPIFVFVYLCNKAVNSGYNIQW